MKMKDTLSVGALASLLTRQTIIGNRFRFNMTADDALKLMTTAYGLEVAYRHGRVVYDECTVANLKDFAGYITQPNPKFGVMLCGTVGNGKSTLLFAFRRVLNLLAQQGHFDFLDEHFKPSMRIYEAPELVQLSGNYKEFSEIKRLSMIGIDDLGTEPAEYLDFGNPTYPLMRLLESRYNSQSFTFITTNLTPAEIRMKYGDRIADRFNEMLHVIVSDRKSYRGRNKQPAVWAD